MVLADAHFSYGAPRNLVFSLPFTSALEPAKRLKLNSADRLLWICLFRLWRDWCSALAIIKPETVVAWHRAGFRLFWTWKVRRGQPGRPLISSEVRDLIRKMCRENPCWGAPRIHGELLKFGIDRREQRHQIQGAVPQASVSDLAHIPGESRQAARSR
jgi:hypothetical protein